MSENKNLLIAVFLSSLVLMSWQYFFETPNNIEQQKQIEQQQEIQQKKIELTKEADQNIEVDRATYITSSIYNRVHIDNGKIKGSINLKGFSIDDLELLGFKETIEPNSENVVLLSPVNTASAYFAEFGWACDDKSVELPKDSTIWAVDKHKLGANDNVTLSWKNSQNITFKIIVTLDDDYMFNIKQIIENHSGNVVSIYKYGAISRKMKEVPSSQSILHEGLIGTEKAILFEKNFADLKKDETKKYSENKKGDWLGITDKYWLTSIMPQETFSSNIEHRVRNDKHIFQIEYFSDSSDIAAGSSKEDSLYFFAGAKNLKTLDHYAKLHNINLFDRAVDFGWFYFLTKPMFLGLQFLYSLAGNFGIAILLLTVIIKLIMYPLANKSFHSMNRMKALNPQLTKLKERYAEDKAQLNKETMELYKKEGINPLSGCLPLILQIPVFFSLYKVLFVTIEMRQAPFFGWVHDLSAPDPTTIFNLFGLIPWSPPAFLMIGAWPIIMAITMYLQQKMSPQPADPVQAQVMKLLPLFFVFMFGSFPAGLVIYWAWNNILSILQQWMIDSNKTN